MVNYCSFCKVPGDKGYFRYPPDQRANYLAIAGLPPEKKADNLRVCFRHFQANDLIFVGDQLRIRKGKQSIKKTHLTLNLAKYKVGEYPWKMWLYLQTSLN